MIAIVYKRVREIGDKVRVREKEKEKDRKRRTRREFLFFFFLIRYKFQYIHTIHHNTLIEFIERIRQFLVQYYF